MQIETITSWAARLVLVVPARRARPSQYEAGSFLRWFSTGMRAAADYRQLEAMTEGQLAARGLTRAGIPRAVFERHFAE